jgi:hypothetical protein
MWTWVLHSAVGIFANPFECYITSQYRTVELCCDPSMHHRMSSSSTLKTSRVVTSVLLLYMNSPMEWNQEKTLLLNKPILWDPRDPQHYNKLKKILLFFILLQITPSHKKESSTRDSYVRHHEIELNMERSWSEHSPRWHVRSLRALHYSARL